MVNQKMGIPNPDEYPDWKPEELPKRFTRKELQELSQRACKLKNIIDNPYWKRAYERLEDAANILDAFMARTEEK